MLQSDGLTFEDHGEAACASAAPKTTSFEDRLHLPHSSYGGRGTPNYAVILLILLCHAALIYALTEARHHYVRVREAKLSVINLTPPAPPPPTAEPSPPSETKVMAPLPIVRTPPVNQPRMTAIQEPATISPAPVTVIASPSPVAATTPSAPPPTTVQSGDLATQMLSGKPPRYPIESRRRREQGTVVLSLTVGFDGHVESIAVARSSGAPRLDDAARDAVRRWRWQPLVRDGQPMRVRGIVEIPFMLTGTA